MKSNWNDNELYVLITFPDVQSLMELEGFDDNAFMELECRTGSGSYFVNLKWLNDNENNEL